MPIPVSFSEADRLRGGYGPYRANNDLLYYHLDVRVDPDKRTLSGKNSIRFKMLESGTRIQLDLVPALHIDKILLQRDQHAPRALHYERAAGRTVYVDFPETLRPGPHRFFDPGTESRRCTIPDRFLVGLCSAATH